MNKDLVKKLVIALAAIMTLGSCSKNNNGAKQPPKGSPFGYIGTTIDDSSYKTPNIYNISDSPLIMMTFSQPVNASTASSGITLSDKTGFVSVRTSLANDSTLIIRPASLLHPLTLYSLVASTDLKSTADSPLNTTVRINFTTGIDSSDKFPQISDSSLLTLVEQQTFNYFWSGADQNSGMAKERASQSQVTTGGSGFGVMAILAGVQRGFITRAQALARITTIVHFLTNSATRYHGAFSHWMNGATGATIPFGTQDNGGDIVETSYMIEGLLCARQYFNSTTDSGEINLRGSINSIYDSVDWNWYRQNGQNVLYWNWSPNYNFAINVQVRGWCEAMITYILGASSPNDSFALPKVVYDEGWAQNGAEKNGSAYYGITLPLGPAYGGPLFFAHYSFLGINPTSLTDAYANYWTQNMNHSLINYTYCVANPHRFYGYSSSVWGLTA